MATIETVEDQVAADMLDSQRANIVAATAQEQQLKQQAELQSNEVERYDAAIEKQWPQSGSEPEQDDNEMEQLIAAASQLPQSTKSAPGGGYLDNLSKISQIDTASSSQPEGANDYLDRFTRSISDPAQSVGDVETMESPRPYTGTNLRSLIENSKPKSGPSTSYLDSL